MSDSNPYEMSDRDVIKEYREQVALYVDGEGDYSTLPRMIVLQGEMILRTFDNTRSHGMAA